MLVYWLMFGVFAFAAATFNTAAPAAAGHRWAGWGGKSLSAAPLVAAIFLIGFIGLRYRVGGDWHNYEVAFDNARYHSLGELLQLRQEQGYMLLNWLAVQLGLGLWFVNLACAIPFAWGLIQLCRQQPNPWLALVVATPFLIIVVGMGFARQAAALGFLMAGLANYMRTRSLRNFVLLTLAGALFHRTVLVFIPIILVAAGRSKFVSILLGLVAVALLYLTVLSSNLEYYQQGYLQGRYDAAGAQIRVAMNFLPAVLLFLSKDRFYRSPEEKIVWKTFAVLALITGLMLPFVSSSVILDRLGMYLIPLQMFVFSRAPSVYSPSAQESVGWRGLVVAYSATVLFVWFNYGYYSAGWLPYRTYLGSPS